jgi:hypothetical protein
MSISFSSVLLSFTTSGPPLLIISLAASGSLSLIIIILLLKLRRAPNGAVKATTCWAASAKITRLYIEGIALVFVERIEAGTRKYLTTAPTDTKHQLTHDFLGPHVALARCPSLGSDISAGERKGGRGSAWPFW